MPTNSFGSPLTLAVYGGHVDLSILLIDREANIEEVNNEGYTPLMEAAREGHKEMVALLLSQGANINAQTEETQETALTLACCGGFLDFDDFLIKAGTDIELGASLSSAGNCARGTLRSCPIFIGNCSGCSCSKMEDTTLTYDVVDLLLQFRAIKDLEDESEWIIK